MKTFSQDEYHEFTQHLQIPKLSDEDRDGLEGPQSYEECKNVLESFQNDKLPGEDKFTMEFYKFVFDLPGKNLLACLKGHCHEHNFKNSTAQKHVYTIGNLLTVVKFS